MKLLNFLTTLIFLNVVNIFTATADFTIFKVNSDRIEQLFDAARLSCLMSGVNP
ncbi:MAG: hypothetical protein PUP91_35435 [Rhizonema sp. PD37]|nr:hypothetical protein [Rhizonema sp. PD37]